MGIKKESDVRLSSDFEVRNKSSLDIQEYTHFLRVRHTLSTRTILQYCYHLDRFLTYKENNPEIKHLQITMSMIEKYASRGLNISEDEQKYKRKKVLVYYTLKRYYEMKEWDMSSIVKEFKRISKKTRYPKNNQVEYTIKEPELYRIIDAIKFKYIRKPFDVTEKQPLDEEEKLKMRSLIQLMYYSGCRISELLLSTPRDYDFLTTPVTISIIPQISKTKQKRLIFLKHTCVSDLKQYIEKYRTKEKYVFVIDSRHEIKTVRDVKNETARLNWLLKKYLEESKITRLLSSDFNISAHKFRHAFSQRLDAAGVTLPTISHAMGHSSIDMTGEYMRKDQQQMRDEHMKKVENYEYE